MKCLTVGDRESERIAYVRPRGVAGGRKEPAQELFTYVGPIHDGMDRAVHIIHHADIVQVKLLQEPPHNRHRLPQGLARRRSLGRCTKRKTMHREARQEAYATIAVRADGTHGPFLVHETRVQASDGSDRVADPSAKRAADRRRWNDTPRHVMVANVREPRQLRIRPEMRSRRHLGKSEAQSGLRRRRVSTRGGFCARRRQHAGPDVRMGARSLECG